ncbi:MAG: hypothetical protein WBM03_14280 [Steroidobacteraceae bacterium]
MTITSLRPSLNFALGLVALASLPSLAAADVVTGTVTPATAKAVIVDASGKTIAELKPGAYQLQLAPGRYKAKCLAPTQREQEFLSLSEPVTVNVDCG